MYIRRDIEDTLKKAAKQFPALIVAGPRQSGKTTLLRHLFAASHRYVSMDNPDTRLMASQDPAFFLENYPPPLIIDEVQYAPGIFPYLKELIDKKRNARGQFLLTGSQSFPLMARVTESLAGRMAVFNLLGLSLAEQFTDGPRMPLASLKKRVLNGSFPEIATKSGLNSQWWFAGYLQTYLERDLRQLRQVGDLTDFQRFLQLLAAFNGQIMNLSGLSRDLGVAVNTVKGWISILEASGQIVSIKPFYMNRGKRIIKSPKIYFLDTGLLCYLNGLTSPAQVFKGMASGQLFETLVLGEIIRTFYNKGVVPRIFWWRTSNGEEVDFVIEHRARVIPIEVKLSSRATPQMARSLASFIRLFAEKIDRGILLTLLSQPLKLDKKITALPFGELAGLF
ncbi:MAG: ATP-binding protein [Planctomycetota bacterium]